ncbi:nitroreductase [Pontivivens insulae]|uniref:Nitroreductase NfnB n=1 Tax=Pontivivens insulae TaxID=1639689 RepID=A0A2R8A7Y9_9RHOB|nr:nitroreductase [Pontivivens insulae]RED18446.1 nitroreductase [Pontivivens insulae]SPF28344.1 Nitroreductase NfnB [Pontivivens insulae]
MRVSEAVTKRRSTRAFLPTQVDPNLLKRLVAKAGRTASGGNLQPWHVHLLTGDGMARFREAMAPRRATGQADTPEYPVYPQPLAEPYRTRRFAVGEAMYAKLDIPREDKAKRLEWFARNWDFFGAPAALFLFVDRQMGAAQWTDLGAYLNTVMLLLVEEGLASCPQEAWSVQHETVSRFCDVAPNLMLFAGLAIGYADPDADVNELVTERADAQEWMTHHA